MDFHIERFMEECEDGENYELLDVKGKGSYGIVFKAWDKVNNKLVAIKKVMSVFQSKNDIKRVMREIKFLQNLSHPNIVKLLRILIPTNKNQFKNIFLVFEYFEYDLRTVIQKQQYRHILIEKRKTLMFQILCAIKYLHENNIVHRDIKPANILVSEDFEQVVLCDFGLARYTFHKSLSHIKNSVEYKWTDYIATRWYRPPEICDLQIIKEDTSYFTLDIWGIGCLFAEFFTFTPLFKGKDNKHQLQIIMEVFGKIEHPEKFEYVQSLDVYTKFAIDFQALVLITNMLRTNPEKRYTVDSCLSSKYFCDIPKTNVIKNINSDSNKLEQHIVPEEEFWFDWQTTLDMTWEMWRIEVFKLILASQTSKHLSQTQQQLRLKLCQERI